MVCTNCGQVNNELQDAGIFFGLIINLFIAHNPGCAIFLFDIQIVKTRVNKENMSGGNLIINLKGNRIVQ